MKTRLRHSRRQQGSVLIVTLFIAFLFGMFLYSYLDSVREQKLMVARSHAWNSALTLAEAGVDEALAQLNPGAPQPNIDRTANGWGTSGGLYGPMSRSLASGSYSVVYTADTNPVIYATGYVTIPAFSATIQRVLRVGTTKAPLFTVAGGARNGIDLKGNNINSDSFNSTLATLSTGGFYDPTKTSTNGDLASIAGIVNVQNAYINGSVALGPTATDNMNNGTVTGGVSRDFNVEFEDVVLPQVSWLPVVPLATPTVINGISYDYVFSVSSNYYTVNNLSGNIYVPSNTVITLKLTGNAQPGTIAVGGAGATSGKLTIYMDGPTFSLGGGEIVESGSALNLSYYGTTNNTQINFTGNSSFTGTMYAPEADIKMGGGGNNSYDLVGSIIANTIGLNGHFTFHFDEALLGYGASRGYVANSWREL